MPRILLGPVTATFVEQHLAAQRQRGDLRCFGPGPGLDLSAAASDSWEDLVARLPPGWQPEAVAVWLGADAVPRGVWEAPVPIIGLVPGGEPHWDYHLRVLPRCTRVLADAPQVERFRRAGFRHVRPADLSGLGRDGFEWAPPATSERDIDLLWLTDTGPAARAESGAWLARLARLGRRFRVAVRPSVSPATDRALLARAKIAFHAPPHAGANRRAWEAVAAGALLLHAGGHGELSELLTPGEHYLACDAATWDDQVERALADEDLRQRVVDAARARLPDLAFGVQWDRAWGAVGDEVGRGPVAATRAGARDWLLDAAVAGQPLGPEARTAAAAWAAERPGDAEAHELLAGAAPDPDTAVASLRRAAGLRPGQPLAALNLAEALAAAGRLDEAGTAAQEGLRAVARLAEAPELPLAGRRIGGSFDHFRWAWEDAGRRHAGDPDGVRAARLSLVRDRLAALRAALGGDLTDHAAAALGGDPATLAAYGCALARAGRLDAAVGPLRRALDAQPLDTAAARALFQAYRDLGEEGGARRLASERRALAAVAGNAVSPEPWAAGLPPDAGAPASVVLVCGDLPRTRRALGRVLRHARPPFEVVLADAAVPGVADALRAEFAGPPGPYRWAVSASDTPRPAPAARDAGTARARGEFVVFLEAGAAVAAGWLEGLVAAALAAHPSAGAAAPLSNAAPAGRAAPAPYGSDLAGLDGHAARQRRGMAGQIAPAGDLGGPCLLVTRDALRAVGPPGGGYASERLAAADFALRLRGAGYRPATALPVYIHGDGEQAVADSPADRDRFRERWGSEGLARLAEAPPPPAPESAATAPAPLRRMRVSLTMIVKDEADNLRAGLPGLAELFDEIVVVDTGSADGTPAVAAELGAVVSSFPWIGDFAAARNAALDRATGDYAFWLDADDRLFPADRDALRELFAALPDGNTAYVLPCACPPGPEGGATTVVDHVRLFRRRPEHRWRFRVHEQILPALRQTGADVRRCPATVTHVGYQDAALRRRKLARDRAILDRELAERPGDPFALFNLGSILGELGEHDAALEALGASLAASHPGDSIVRKLHALIAGGHRQAGRSAEALAACRRGREWYPADPELLFLEAALLRDAGDAAGAEARWARILEGAETGYFGSLDRGVAGHKARHNLAALCLEQGRRAEAAAHWRAAVAEEPGFAPAWLGLAELALAAGDGAGLDAAEAALAGPCGAAADAAALGVRRLLGAGRLSEAAAAARAVVERYPDAFAPRLLLAHALLQDGRDLDAAERALQDVLAIAPDHAESKRNLEILRAQRNSDVKAVSVGVRSCGQSR